MDPIVTLTCSGFLLDVSHLCSILDQLLLDSTFMLARSWVCGYQLCSFLDINCFHLEVTPAQKMRRSNHPVGNSFSAFVSWRKQSTLHPWLTNSPHLPKVFLTVLTSDSSLHSKRPLLHTHECQHFTVNYEINHHQMLIIHATAKRTNRKYLMSLFQPVCNCVTF